jgi:hypothetical protein
VSDRTKVEDAVRGVVTPRLFTVPLRELTPETSLGFDVAEFAERVLLYPLMPWQKEFLIRALELVDVTDSFGQVVDRRLRFRTVLLTVARQNGKTSVMIVLALYYMMVLAPGELVIGTAQNLDTSGDTWADAVKLLQRDPEEAPDDATAEHWDMLANLIAPDGVFKQRGGQALTLTNGSVWKVAPARRTGGRSKSAKLVMLDELREHLSFDAWEAISNTTLAKAGALVLGVSNAGDVRSVVLKKQRDSALAKRTDPETSLAIFEWSAPGKNDVDGEPEAKLDDVNAWLRANPACGWGFSDMTVETLRAAREGATDSGWQTENLCQWVTVMEGGPWKDGVWKSREDQESKIHPSSPVVVACDTSLDRSMSYWAIAGFAINPRDGSMSERVHVEVMKERAGNAWAAGWMNERFDKLGPAHVVLQGPKGAPAVDVGEALEELGVPVSWAQGAHVTGSAVKFYDAVRDGRIVHRGQPGLDMAAQTAQLRYAGDGVFMWDRRKSALDVAPLVAVSMAYFFLTEDPDAGRRSAYEDEDAGLIIV